MGDAKLDHEDAVAQLTRAIDRSSAVPVTVQLRGALEYGIATGEVEVGTRLPSVRRLARQLGLSPVTVGNVYAGLHEAGMVEGRVGAGTFVIGGGPAPRSADGLRELERRIDALVNLGRDLGLSRTELAYRVGNAPLRAGRVRILMLGTFHEATVAYAADIRRSLRPGDEILARTTGEVAADRPRDIALVVAPRTLRAEAEALFPDLPVIGLTLIPNEATRVALAAIPPRAQVAAVSYFPKFLSVMRAGINRFAPHVTRLVGAVRGQADLPDIVARADVLIHSTGADYLRRDLRDDQIAIEYRHTPDGHCVEADLLPAIDACRERAGQEERRRA